MLSKQLIAAFAFLLCSLNFNPVWSQKPDPSKTKNNPKLAFKKVKTAGSTLVMVPYKKNEIVVDFTGAKKPEASRTYLTSKGMHFSYACPCQPTLEVWVTNDPEFDPIGVVEGAAGRGKAGGGDAGMSLNFALDPFEGPVPSGRTATPFSNLDNTSAPVVKIAVLDTGVDDELNIDLLQNALRNHPGVGCAETDDTPHGLDVTTFRSSAPADQHGHGTHVNGIIAGIPEALDGRRVNQNVRPEILNVKITDGDGDSGYLNNAICGMYYAMHNKARILNLSWGFRDDSVPAAMIPFLRLADSNNVLIVAGAGNDSAFIDSAEPLKFWPAGFSQTEYGAGNVISVGAYDQNKKEKKRASFSNYGNADVFAPGVRIESTYLDRQPFAFMSGTSMATPFVTRVAASIIARRPGIKAKAVKKCIKDSAVWSFSAPVLTPAPILPDQNLPRNQKQPDSKRKEQKKPQHIKILDPNTPTRCD